MASIERTGEAGWQNSTRHTVKAAGFAILAISFVVCAALFISIIQFQLRIIEAKNQSKNFSLISLSQSVAMETELESSVDYVQRHEDLLARYETVNSSYLSHVLQFVNLICANHDKITDRQACVAAIAGALQSDTVSSQYIHSVISRFAGFNSDKLPADIEPIEAAAVKLAATRNEFTQTHDSEITKVRISCAVIEQYVLLSTVSGGSDALQLAVKDTQAPSIMNSMALGYVTVARARCFSNFNRGGAATFVLTAAEVKAETPDPAPGITNATTQSLTSPMLAGPKSSEPGFSVGASPQANQSAGKLQADLSNALFFDLISYYRFYERLLGTTITSLAVIAPVDVTFILLVILCGGLGAVLRIAAESYNPKLFGVTHQVPRSKVVYSFVLGVMCALIVYILARTVYTGLGEASYSDKSGNLSPFVTAFLAIVSGLISEEAFQQIIAAGKALLTSSTGKRAANP
jgi:hypothetical protein